MKKELLILSMVMAASCGATGCLGSVSNSPETDPENFDCKQAAEIEGDYNDVLVELEENELKREADSIFFENELERSENENEALRSSFSDLEASRAYLQLRYDGLLEQFRDLQENYGAMAAEYLEYKSLCELHGVTQIIEVEAQE